MTAESGQRSSEAAARAAVQAMPGVSRETLEEIDGYVRELSIWQKRINLVSPTALHEIWARHVLDSVQLLQHASEDARHWIDLGSGGGFPGILIACQLKAAGRGEIHLVESSNKKAAFLRHVVVMLDLPATVHCVRIDAIARSFVGSADVVTARALASLDDLLGFANPLLKTDGQCLFPKGREVELELTEAANNWQFSFDLLPSLTARDARIVRISRIRRRSLDTSLS